MNLIFLDRKFFLAQYHDWHARTQLEKAMAKSRGSCDDGFSTKERGIPKSSKVVAMRTSQNSVRGFKHASNSEGIAKVKPHTVDFWEGFSSISMRQTYT
jgi:hypothetical protein